MGKKTARCIVDPADMPPLSARERAELAALAVAADERIDTSDIPPLADAFWKNAVRGRFYRPQ